MVGREPISPGGAVLASYPIDLEFPYGVLFDTEANDLWISNISFGDVPGDNRNYRFLRDGTQTGDTIDVRELGITPMDGAYNPTTGMLWQVSGLHRVGCVNEMDPGTKALTGTAICPEFSTQQTALAYDAATDTFYSGSIDDGVITHFNARGEILETREVVLSISGLAFNPATGHLFVLHQAVEDAFTGPDVLVIDPGSDYAVLGAFFIGEAGVWSSGARGMEIDCEGHLWLVDQPGDIPYLLEVDSGEAGICGNGP